LNDAKALANPDIAIVLVGNKIDLSAEREVSFLEASRFAQENELMFLETSALTGEGVSEVFLKCARTILSKIESGVLDPDSMNSGVQPGSRKPQLVKNGKVSGSITENKTEKPGCC